MALGTLGSTLNDELNRLANGGTYRDMDDMVDEALAAKQWANRENIIPYSTDTVGILNEIAGLGLDKRNWLDFNGVCNYIAGTTGLPAAAALRQVYATTDLLTGVASYYVDAYNAQIGGGYLYLPGVNSNNATTPDAAALDITGDIDLRVKVAMDNWTPATEMALVGKWQTGGQISYLLRLTTGGNLKLYWSSNGTYVAGQDFTSSVSVGVVNGSTKWVRATLDVDNGASGKTATFYTSDDGTTWTQLGTPQTTATAITLFNGTSALEIGTSVNGTEAPLKGKVFRAQVLNGIGGTTVFDANFETAITAQTVTSFTATTGQTVTINRNTYNFQLDTIPSSGAAGSLLPTTVGSSTAADSNDPKFLDHTGTNYVYVTGVTNNSLSVPDSAALDITGDIDLRAFVALDDWTPGGRATLIAKSGATNTSYRMDVETTGALRFVWSTTGTDFKTATSSVSTSFVDGTSRWVRATLDVDNGASGNDVKFFTSTDGTTWIQLGTTVTTAGVTSIYSGSENVLIGTNGTAGEVLTGKVFRAQIFNGIDGTKVLDVDTSVITAGSATSFTAVTGQTVTINRSTSGRKSVAVTQPTWLFGTDDYMEVNNRYMSSGTYLYLPGVNGNYASTLDAAALDVTGDIDIRVKAALDSWTTSQNFVSKATSATSQFSYQFSNNTSGFLGFSFSLTGSTAISAASTVAHNFSNGTTQWVRATRESANGDVKFFTSTDGTNWTQLGTTVSTTSGNIYSGTAILELGSRNVGTAGALRGNYFRAMIYSDLTETTLAFDANFETSITSLLQTSFTESSTNAATVTINRSGSTYRSAGITAAGYLYPGATNTFSASATDFLNFGASTSGTAFVLFRNFATPISSSAMIGNQSSAGGFNGWELRNFATNSQARFDLVSSGASVNTSQQNYTLNNLTQLFGIINRDNQTLQTYVGTTAGSTISIASVTSINSILPVRIGAWNGGSLLSFDGEIYAAAVFRTVLTPTQIRQITNYFANREVYL